ncbi:hypothetical protein ACFQ9Q_02025 [Streptomyces virginiae]|uniref:hypothetical protein n=1 Tax=Streptomyces virginiae TaxID=1961 RepID=UPI00369E9B0D
MRDTTNRFLIAAWATVPEVAEAEKRHTKALELQRAFRRGVVPDHARAAVVDEAVSTFLASGNWPANVGSRAAEAYAAALAWEAEHLALRRAVEQARVLKEDTRDVLSDNALAYLGERLQETLSAALTAAEALDGVDSDAEAIEAGGAALAAWGRLRQLRQDLQEIRAAQWAVLRAVSDNPHEVELWRRAGHGEVQRIPVDRVPQHEPYTVEFLLWLAASGSAYVPESLNDLRGYVDANTPGPVMYDDRGPLVDYSPSVTPLPDPRPSEVYPHSRTPQLDNAGPTPPQPKPNATVRDEQPPAWRY